MTSCSSTELSDVQRNYCDKLLGTLNSLRCNDVLCDVTITADGHDFAAHKGVLAASSDYFNAIFTTPMKEKHSQRINVDVSPSIVDELLTYLYTGKTRLCQSNVKELLVAADYLVVGELKQQCSRFLAQSLSYETCLEIYALAVQCHCPILAKECEHFILHHFSLVRSGGEDFSLLDCQLLERIIQHDELIIDEEKHVYDVMISWVTNDIQNRQQFIDQLFSHVRLCSLTDEYITENIQTQPLIRQSSFCKELVRQRLQEVNKKEPRNCLRPDRPALVAVGGISRGKVLKDTIALIPNTDNAWLSLRSMHVEREEHVVVACQGRLYAIGGVKRAQDIECYDPRLDTWSTVASLPERAIASAGVCLDGKIVIMGGKDGFECVSSVYSYDPSSHLVAVLPPLTFSRKASCSVALNGEIYVIGGCTYDNDSLDTVEKLQPAKNDKWEKASPLMNHRKYACAEVLVTNKIIVVGGYQDTSSTALNSCEVYDPETNEWQLLCNLVIPRATAAMARIDGHVYVLGGRSDRQSTDTIEYYDEDHDQWCVASVTLPYPCAWFKCAAILLPKTLISECRIK